MQLADARRGMTLLEVIAALGIAGLSMLGGILLLDQINDGAFRISSDGRAQSRQGNAERTLHRLFLDAEPSFDSTRRFRGDSRSIEYFTQCQAPSGWTEACHVTVTVDSVGDSSSLSVQFDSGDRVTLAPRAGMTNFRFFDPASRDSAWVASWVTSATLPMAVGIVSRSDTVVLPVGSSRE